MVVGGYVCVHGELCAVLGVRGVARSTGLCECESERDLLKRSVNFLSEMAAKRAEEEEERRRREIEERALLVEAEKRREEEMRLLTQQERELEEKLR